MHERRLEAVQQDERGAGHDEDEKTAADLCRRDETERDRSEQPEGAEHDEHPGRDPRPERPTLQLVKGVRRDADSEEKGQKCARDDPGIGRRRERGPE